MVEITNYDDAPSVDADDEWNKWNKIGDPVLHIQLRDWADVMVVAPLSAHTLAKLSNGLCDDTLSCIIRAWDYGYTSTSSSSTCTAQINSNENSKRRNIIDKKQKSIIIAPAMNTAMWEHPITKQQLDVLRSFWNSEQYISKTVIVDPQVKTLACGDLGKGAMADVAAIVDTVSKQLT